MADLGEEAFSSQMKVVATFLRLLEELMRNKQQDLRYGTKTQRRGILGRMKDFVGGIFKKVYDGTFGRLSRNGKDYGQLDLNDPAVAKLFADTMKQMGMDAMHEDNNLLFSTSDVAKILAFSKMVEQELGKKIEHENDTLVVVTVVSDAYVQAFCEVLSHGCPFYSINRRVAFVRFYHFTPSLFR